MSDSFALAARELRTLDSDRYAASLMIVPEHREAVQAIFAFAAEIAAISERVSEPGPGEIRLQWWVDALEGREHGTVAQNPVADALFKTLESTELPAGPLLRLLAARRFDLYGDPMPNQGQFEGYAGETVSVLYQYAAMVLAGAAVDDVADAAGHLGVAQALAGHLRAFAYNASRGRLFLPLSIFTAHGVREADIHAGRDTAETRAALAQVVELAHTHAGLAHQAIKGVPAKLRPAFASIALVDQDLKALARISDRPAFASIPAFSPFRRLAALTWWTMRRG